MLQRRGILKLNKDESSVAALTVLVLRQVRNGINSSWSPLNAI